MPQQERLQLLHLPGFPDGSEQLLAAHAVCSWCHSTLEVRDGRQVAAAAVGPAMVAAGAAEAAEADAYVEDSCMKVVEAA
jgi:hypothetical protein